MKSSLVRLGAAVLLGFALVGCSGDKGDTGATGPTGPAGPPGAGDPTAIADLQAQIDAITQATNPEQCSLCHTGDQPVARTGTMHQASYDELYQDGVIKVSNMAYVAPGAGTTATLTFKMTKDGNPFDCTKSTASDSDFAIGSYFTAYAGTQFAEFTPGRISLAGTKAYDAGTNTCTFTSAALTSAQVTTANSANGIATVYGTDAIVSRNAAAHLVTGKYPFGGVLKVGTVDYTSKANVSGCENCHTRPFLKHTYIYGQVDDGTGNKGLDFYECKGCHVDTGSGGHIAWQMKKDGEVNGDLTRWAEVANGAATTADENTKYAYKTRLMNDVHMSHNMEFAYPQSMKNCVTCHAGKLDPTAGGIMANANFRAETCISCHSVDGLTKMMSSAAFSHASYVSDLTVLRSTTCTVCHDGSAAPTFEKLHNGGYDPEIYAYDFTSHTATKYANAITVKVDSATLTGNTLDIKFSATGSAGGLAASSIAPTVLVGLYGYNSKDFLVAAHGTAADGQRNLEYVVGTTTNPRFTTVSAAGGSWEVTADLTMWADKIASGAIKRAEIAVTPSLKDASGTVVGLNAPSRTFDLTKNAFDDAFFPDIVQVNAGCNTCHDQLATTFHTGARGGNIKVCRICHEVSNPGAHLEMQSRSIDSYIHAIHAFQVLDRKNYDLTKLVDKMEYEEHINQQFPRFGTDCKSCHVAGMFDVPNQGKSMPSVLSASAVTTDVRNISGIPAMVTGPATRACGACHRSEAINEDDATALATLNAHWKTFGYEVENQTGLWASIVEKMMTLFSNGY